MKLQAGRPAMRLGGPPQSLNRFSHALPILGCFFEPTPQLDDEFGAVYREVAAPISDVLDPLELGAVGPGSDRDL